MGLVADNEVPPTIGRLQLQLHILIASEFVEPRDNEIGFQEPIAGPRRFELVVGQDFERQIETAIELVLPLLGEAPGADDQAALQITASDQLLDQEPRHDGLARAGIVRKQEAQRLAGKHAFIDGRDLVRQRLNDRRVNGQDRIEQMSEVDALGLGYEAEQGAIPVEAPGPPFLHDLQIGFAVAV